jgi:hypothetical protein
MNTNEEIREFAERFCAQRKKEIKKQTVIRKSLLQQLAFLFSELHKIRMDLFPTEFAQRSDIKTGLINSYENDNISEYIHSEQFNSDFLESIEAIKKRSDFLYDDGKLNPKNYTQKNETYLPFEFRVSFLELSTTKLDSLRLEVVAGAVYGQILLIEDIESEISNLINENQLGKEDLEELKKLLENKIKWVKPLNEFAFIMDRLIKADYINIDPPGKSPQRAELFRAHFLLPGKLGGEASQKSIKDAFNNLNSKDKSLSRDKKDSIAEIFYDENEI